MDSAADAVGAIVGRKLKLRLYRPEDEQAVRAIFAQQNLAVDLPLPWRDPAVCVAVVGEEADGRISMALIGRQTVEAHLVIAPEEPDGARKVAKAMCYAEGALLEISRAAQEKKCAAVTDIIAEVPRDMGRMRRMMQFLGFVPESDRFQRYWKWIGK